MKRLIFGIVIAGMLFPVFSFAAGNMINNDDLERKYPKQPENRSQQWNESNERSPENCARLREEYNRVKKEALDSWDTAKRGEGFTLSNELMMEYMKKCPNQPL